MKKYLPLTLISSLLLGFFYFHLYRYLSMDSLRLHQHLLLQWRDEHYLQALLIFLITYILAIAAAFPVAFFLSLTSGFLFGIFTGTLIVLVGATLGSILLYLSVKLALANWFEEKVGSRIKSLEAGLRENAFFYLLAMRIIPIFPFWLINIASGLLALPLITFIAATALGLIPATLIYTSLGKHLASLLQTESPLGIKLLLQTQFLLPLICLAILAVLPIIYRHFKTPAR